MPGRKPRPNWIYMIDPKRVALKCKNGHNHVYDISGVSELDCFETNCNLTLNSSRVMRGKHPHIIWSEYSYGKFQAYHVIPLTSKDTFRGLPSVYPIRKNIKNSLDKDSLALVHQLTIVDSECFKYGNGSWMQRMGTISQDIRKEIELRLKFSLNLSENPSDDWFAANASPQLLKKIFSGLNEEQKENALTDLLDSI